MPVGSDFSSVKEAIKAIKVRAALLWGARHKDPLIFMIHPRHHMIIPFPL